MAAIEELVGARARDDQGRFVSATPAEPEKVSAPTEPVQQKAETPEPVIPVKEPPVVETPPVTPVAAPSAPVQPVESPREAAYKLAMREEREKRQAAEARLRELQTPKAPVDPWADLPGALKSQEQAFEERLFLERCNTTEELAREKHKDFDEVREVFLEAANANPTLWAQIRQERNPAAFVYREGLRIRELKDVNGDFSAYKSKLETDLRVKLEAEYAAKYGAKPAPTVPTSLNSDASPPPVEVYQGPKPLNQILRNASRS
jgi:hypothetical protein